MENPRILIVTVIYNQTIYDTNVYKTLLKDEKDVFIYDNSPIPGSYVDLPSGWIYVSDPTNPGLSMAYNKAARYALKNGFDWILISDQDTIFPNDAVRSYRKHIESYKEYHMFIPQVKTVNDMYLSPVKSMGYMARISQNAPVGQVLLDDYAIINSGLLVRTDSFLSCGGYNENVFLDFSDIQFIERFATKFPFAFVIDIVCRQDFSNISDSKEKKLARFRLFCRSLSGFRSNRKYGKLKIFVILIKRLVNLCVTLRSIRPISIFLKNYKTV